jgi:hypothetical protein
MVVKFVCVVRVPLCVRVSRVCLGSPGVFLPVQTCTLLFDLCMARTLSRTLVIRVLSLSSKSAVAMSINIGTCVAVTGETLRVKTALKSVGGGIWVQSISAWVFPEASRAAIEVAVRSAGVQVTSTTGATHSGAVAVTSAAESSGPSSVPPPASAVPSVNAQATLTIRPHKKAILVEGDTMNVKPQLKTAGGRWNSSLSGWIFPGKRQAEIMALLQADPTNTVTVKSTSAAPPAKKAKTDPEVEEEEDEDEDDA